MNKAAFFDRDGTINVDVGYLHNIKDLDLISGTPQIISKYRNKGYLIIVITNQSGIARGMFDISQMKKINNEINRRLLIEYDTYIDAFYYCPHLPEISGECNCRKPKPGLFLQAIKDYNINPKASVSFGDSKRDEEASKSAGIEEFYYIGAERR